MKTKLTFSAFFGRVALAATGIILGFSSFTTCEAQAIVGKWKVVSVKLFSAKGPVEHQLPAGDIYEFNFRADHTYLVSQSPGGSPSTGTWSVAGDQLTMLSPVEQRKGIKGRTSTFSITGSKMVRMVIGEPPFSNAESKAEETSVRI